MANTKKQKYPTTEEIAQQQEESPHPALDPDGDAYLNEQETLEEDGAFVKAEHYADDVPIFPGGPLMSEVKSWEKQAKDRGEAHNIFVTPVSKNMTVIWRTLTRVEYKDIVSTPDTDPMQREEMICEQVVLWPKPFNYSVMSKGLAGVPALIAEQVMNASGFSREIGYQPLF